ncbi:MAG: DUF1937 family protein [Planctomycetaceae bacterium]|nr:DUF1937 family protein [Planctomycetaceae bacterium]
MIYLASPYSHPDQTVCELRFHANVRIAAELIRQGHVVFSPIVHGHPLTKQQLSIEWSFWRRIDLTFLEACSELVVLTLPGWEQSVGVTEEIAVAEASGKPVQYLAPPDPWYARTPTLAYVAKETRP